jgi:hypothetical protein
VLQGWSSWTSSFTQAGPGPDAVKSEDRAVHLLSARLFLFWALVPSSGVRRFFVPKAGSAVLIFV